MKWVCFCIIIFCCQLVRCRNRSERVEEILQSDNLNSDSNQHYWCRGLHSAASSCEYSANIIKELSQKSEFEENKLERQIQRSENKILRNVDDMRLKMDEKQEEMLFKMENRIQDRLEILIRHFSRIGKNNLVKEGFKFDPEDKKRNEIMTVESEINIEEIQMGKQQQEGVETELDCSLQISRQKVGNCFGILTSGDKQSGIKTFNLPGENGTSVAVVCNQDVDGGGWTVFQTRKNLPVRENFYRNWYDYKIGFGNLSGEFWLGLTNLHRMTTTSGIMQLRIDLEDSEGSKRYAQFENFYIKSEEENFALNIGAYSGTAGDSLTFHQGLNFSTFDMDNDGWSKNCAERDKGGWWYKSCHEANLNGFQYVGKYGISGSKYEGIDYKAFRDYSNSMAATSMMFRPQYRNNT